MTKHKTRLCAKVGKQENTYQVKLWSPNYAEKQCNLNTEHLIVNVWQQNLGNASAIMVHPSNTANCGVLSQGMVV